MTMTVAEHDQMLSFAATLRTALAEASRDRCSREGVLVGRYGPEPAWLAHERALLLGMVNGRRQRLGHGDVDEDQVAEVEESAAGHCDYAHKYALRLAMLAYGLESKP